MHEQNKRHFLYFKMIHNFLVCVHVTLYTSGISQNGYLLALYWFFIQLTHVMTRCYNDTLILSSVYLSSSHSGYHLAQKSSTINLSDCLSYMVSIYCIVESLTSLLLVREYIGIIVPFGSTKADRFSFCLTGLSDVFHYYPFFSLWHWIFCLIHRPFYSQKAWCLKD